MKPLAPLLALALVTWGIPAEARCYETSTSRVVGRTRCSHFGSSWNIDELWGGVVHPEATIGFAVHSLDVGGWSANLCRASGRSCPTLSSDRFANGSSVVTYSGSLGVNVAVWGPLRFGLATEFGGGSSDARLVHNLAVAVGAPFVSTFALNVGARWSPGRWSLGADLRPGFTIFTASVDNAGAATGVNAFRFGVRANASVQFAVTPYVAVGVFGGADVVEGNDFYGGVMVRINVTRPFYEPR